MGWDIMILNTHDTQPIAQVDTSALPSFGLRQVFIDRLNELFPQIDWDQDFAYGHLDNEDYFGNIGLGKNEEMTGYFWLGIYGGANPLNFIMTLCNEYNCLAFDTVTSEYIIVDNPSDKGWKHIQEFRNYIGDHLINNDKVDSDEK